MVITSTEYIVGSIIGVLTLVQLLYLLIIYNAIHRRYKAEQKGKLKLAESKPGLSVIITASNQEEVLAKHLPRILEQDYPDFEVIVVDDNSTDDTRELLERLAQQYLHLYSTFTSDSIRYISHKKLALTLGIKAAKKEWVVFTDANCYPTSPQWLARLASNCTDEVDVVLGYSNYEQKKGFGNLCYMYDTLLQQVRMLGMTLLGGGHMGIGRNMAYRRELFFTHKGYSRHLDLERGEDDLFINEHVPASRITADISELSVVRCAAHSGRTWANDKLSRLFIRKKMHGASLRLLSLDTPTRILLYIGVTTGIVLGIINHWWMLLGVSIAMWLVYLGCSILVFHRVGRELGERKYNVSIPLLDLIRPWWELYFRLRLCLTSKDMHMRRKV
ncbi:MAG: glycosyltransferase [Bacteroidaceae bacterium]|nr:glycosyltransferase [Bacteroidaceae bacterium]